MDFLFIFPKSLHGFSIGNTFGGFDYHLGASYIRAFLNRQSVSTEMYISHGDSTLKNVAADIIGQKPKIIGFSVYDSNYHLCKTLAEKIREINQNILIIFGGPSATFSDEIIMRDCQAVDICVRWYGEVASYEIYQYHNGNLKIGEIAGITYREKNNIKRNKDRSPLSAIPDLKNESLINALDMFPDPYIERCIPPNRAADLGIVTARGCTYPCVFCNCSAISRGKIYYHSAKRVLKCLHFLEDNASSNYLVAINDDNFSLRPKFHSLLETIAEQKFKKLNFWAEMRTEPLNNNSFKLLEKAGFTKIHFGLESGVPKVLSNIKKVRRKGGENDNYQKEKEYLERIKWAVEKSKQNGISPGVSIILGCPGEDEADGIETLNFVKSLEVDRYAHNFLVIQNGTEISKTHREFGIKVRPFSNRALPLRTELAYDAHKLHILENDGVWLSNKSDDYIQALRLLSGILIGVNCRTNNEFKKKYSGRSMCPVIEFPVFLLSDKLFDWLNTEMTLNTSLWVKHENNFDPHEINNCLSGGNVPIQQVNSLSYIKKANGHGKIRINQLSANMPEHNTRIIERIEGKNLDKEILKKECYNYRKSLMIEINDLSDFNSLDKFAANLFHSCRTMILDKYFYELSPSVKDECRWSSIRCPAVNGLRWFIDEKGTIFTCKNGLPIGEVGDSFKKLKCKVREIWDKENKRRGCNSCIYKVTCSRCLFSFPLNNNDFCDYKSKDKTLWRFIDSIRLIRLLKFTEILKEIQNRVKFRYPKENIQGNLRSNKRLIPIRDCQLVYIDNDAPYLHDINNDFIIQLQKDAARVFSTIFD